VREGGEEENEGKMKSWMVITLGAKVVAQRRKSRVVLILVGVGKKEKNAVTNT